MDSSFSEDEFVLPSLSPSPVLSAGSRPLPSRSPSPPPVTSNPARPLSCLPPQAHPAPSRPLSQPTSTEIAPEPTRHPTLWYHDGSIIIHVQSRLFKVHQTVLAAHSEVFSGLFTLPRDFEGSGKGKIHGDIDGCPIVVLHDKWEDFEVLLKAIYEPTFWDAYPSSLPLPTPLPTLTPLLSLSSKYLIPTIRTRTISLLKSKLPTTYTDYLARSNNHEKYTSETIMQSIHLAKSYDVPSVLPYLFYCLARLSARRILDHREGDVSWYVKTLSQIAREKLRLAEIALSHSFLYAFRPSPQCLTALCTLSRAPQIEWRAIEARTKPSPLRAWTRWGNLGVCERCVEGCKAEHEQGRREVWERLPSLMGVADGWGVLIEGTGWEFRER